MRFKDLPIRKRLLLANYLMILTPVLCVILLSVSIFWAFGMENINRVSTISFMWPESGPTLSIQFELTRLRVRMDKWHSDKEEPLALIVDHLEDQGLKVALFEAGKPVYVTEQQDAETIREQAFLQAPAGRGGIAWGKQGLAFHYRSAVTGLEAAVVGTDPLIESSDAFQMHSKDLFKSSFLGAFLLGILVAGITALILSRLMARQLLKPLEKLRKTADQISRGDLDTPVVADSQDEIGETLAAFETARLELREAREKREQYDKNRKELLAGIAHDLATPLTKIRGYASGLQDGIADTPEKQERYLRKITDAAENMARLNQTLFLFSKLDLHQVPFHYQVVDVVKALQDYVEDQQDILQQQGMTIIFASALAAAPVKLDLDQFARVLQNIVGNSLKYRKGEQVRLAIAADPADGHSVLLSFADDGQGVPQEQLEKIFESFYRTDRARSHVAKGSGLGLAITKKIIETMGGRIWAEPTKPQGLTICIELPLEEQKYGNHTDY